MRLRLGGALADYVVRDIRKLGQILSAGLNAFAMIYQA
jgi:hypothetical protein